MASQITATLPALDFPQEVDYPTQEDWAAFSAAAEENFGILGGDWSTQMQLWKTQANAMSIELNNNADIAQSVANYQGDWVSQGYTLGQTVSLSGIYYICKLTHATGQNPTTGGSLYWNLALGNWNLKVNNYGNETIAGVKSFTLSPIVPTPTTDFQVATKQYVDTKTWKDINYKSTPVTITSWSYSGTTITLNVVSHTFVVGDYIEVAGLTATTYPANGIHLVTNVTPTTIIFTLSAMPTGTAGVSSATAKGYVLVNGRISESIGVGQTSKNVKTSRMNGVTYTNSTGKPIEVSISVGATGNGTITFNLNGIPAIQTALATGAATEMTKIVPNGNTYLISADATFNILQWFELRGE